MLTSFPRWNREASVTSGMYKGFSNFILYAFHGQQPLLQLLQR